MCAILSVRYVESPPESEDEKAALAQLLDACLSGDSGLHGELRSAELNPTMTMLNRSQPLVEETGLVLGLSSAS